MDKKGFITAPVVIAIALIAVIVGTGGYFAWQKNNRTSSIIPAGWKTYTNSKYDYQFSYPPDFILTKSGWDEAGLPSEWAVITYPETNGGKGGGFFCTGFDTV